MSSVLKPLSLSASEILDEGERLESELDKLIGTTFTVVPVGGLLPSQSATPKSCWNDKAGSAPVDADALRPPALLSDGFDSLWRALRKKDMAQGYCGCLRADQRLLAVDMTQKKYITTPLRDMRHCGNKHSIARHISLSVRVEVKTKSNLLDN
jgi:hypothetical protein